MTNEQIRHFGPFVLNVTKRLLLRNDEPINIGSRGIDLLITLTARPGHFFENQELSKAAWPNLTVEDATLRSHIKMLRRHLGENAEFRYILNSPGRGYSFVAPIQEHLLERDVEFPAFPDVTCGYRTVPPQQRTLIGRSEVIDAIIALMETRRFVSIVAAGGIGKTSVAIATAHATVASFGESSISFIDLSAITTDVHLLTAIATAVNCKLEIADSDRPLLRYLATRKHLIILDGCEHIADLVATIAERIVRHAPNVVLLTTSREALRAEGEYVHHLPPLGCPSERSTASAELLQSAAVQLFLQKAADADHDSPLAEEDLPAIGELCHLVDGNPLAIELAASHAVTHGVARILDLLDKGEEWPGGMGKTLSARHQTLNAMFDWSVNLLTDRERRIFCRLSVFIGTFSLDAAMRIAGDEGDDFQSVANVVLSLVDKSVVSVAVVNQRVNFRLLDTVRLYAAGLLADRGEAPQMAARHAQYMIELISSQTAAGASEQQARLATKAYIGNIRKALDWSLLNSGNIGLGSELAMRAGEIFLAAGDFAESLYWSRLAIDAQAIESDNPIRALRLRMIFVHAALATWTVDPRVEAALASAAAIASSLEDIQRQASLVLASHIYNLRTGRPDASLSAAETLATMAAHIEDQGFGTIVDWSLGNAYHALGKPKQALEHFEAAFLVDDTAAEPKTLFAGTSIRHQARIAMGHSLLSVGAIDSARQIAAILIQQSGDLPTETDRCRLILESGVVILAALGLESTETLIQAAIAKAMSQSNEYYRALALTNLGLLSLVRGQPENGIEPLQHAVAAARERGFTAFQSTALFFLSESFLRSLHYAEALAMTAPPEDGFYNPPFALWAPGLLLIHAQAQLALFPHDLRGAERKLLNAFKAAKDHGSVVWEIRAALLLSEIWMDTGRKDDVVTIARDIHSRRQDAPAEFDFDVACRFLREHALLGNRLF